MAPIVNNQACSVLLPLYNGAHFIEEALTSNLEAMRDIDELLVVNDGSQDISKEALKKFESRDSRIRIINKRHSGLVETLNHGIKHCDNELIARADIDDKYSPMHKVFSFESTTDPTPWCDVQKISSERGWFL
jgi:glycosyltransferase involved in cell wall biosynthesis